MNFVSIERGLSWLNEVTFTVQTVKSGKLRRDVNMAGKAETRNIYRILVQKRMKILRKMTLRWTLRKSVVGVGDGWKGLRIGSNDGLRYQPVEVSCSINKLSVFNL